MIVDQATVFNHTEQLTNALDQGEPLSGIVTSEPLEDGTLKVLSRYEDELWVLPRALFPKIVSESIRRLDFGRIHLPHREAVRRVILKRLLSADLRGNTLLKDFNEAVHFVNFMKSVGCDSFSRVTPLIAHEYVADCKAFRHATGKLTGEGYGDGTLRQKFQAVELCWSSLQGTPYAFSHPWPDSSTYSLVGRQQVFKPKTEVIPDSELNKVFQYAVERLDGAKDLLNLRAKYLAFKPSSKNQSTMLSQRKAILKKLGYSGTTKTFNDDIRELETACWFIVLCTSGIRISELGELESGKHYTVERDDEKFHFMVSVSHKTDEGKTSWLCPEITIRAIDTITRISEPLRLAVMEQLEAARVGLDQEEAARLLNISNSVMLAAAEKKFMKIDVIGALAIRDRINRLARSAGSNWHFTPHQFRRTFARYVVHSQLGDLRYLRDHYKHWSLDMTALYGLDELQDLELYDEIHLAFGEHKTELVGHWLEPDTPIAGGLAGPIIALRNKDESVRTYGSHKDMIMAVSDSTPVRSTGIAWCTNDNDGCGGGQCEDCEMSVIDDRMQLQWEAIYEQQLELRRIAEEMGENGSVTIERTITRCENVLTSLGADMEIIKQRVAANG